MKYTGPKLTPALDKAIRSFARLARKDPAPSLHEWAAEAGIKYTTVHEHRKTLIRLGLMTAHPNRMRSTRLTGSGSAYVSRSRRRIVSRPDRPKAGP